MDEYDLKVYREKFVKTAEVRVNRALKHIKIIGALNDKTEYVYSDADVKKIVKALKDAVLEIETKFKEPVIINKKEEFKLEE
jgi:hypothetical protein|tara:strand:+ start:214 stop:459 length:246 start_codon:yes stop_codon:yes gene_type:complete